jgi:hypothetical protein
MYDSDILCAVGAANCSTSADRACKAGFGEQPPFGHWRSSEDIDGSMGTCRGAVVIVHGEIETGLAGKARFRDKCGTRAIQLYRAMLGIGQCY